MEKVDHTLKTPTDVLARILSYTPQKTIITALDVSKKWRKAANRYFENIRICDVHISPLLTKEIHLDALESRLRTLFARHAPKFLAHRNHILNLLSNPDSKFTEIGLFYPYINDADKKIVNDMIGIDAQTKPNLPDQTAAFTLFEARKILPATHNDPYSANKAMLLRQACEYGNYFLFFFVIRYGATPTVQHLNLAARSNCEIIYNEILETVTPNQETLYAAMLAGNRKLTKTILEKNMPSVNKQFYTPRFLAAARDSKNKPLFQYAEKTAAMMQNK